MEGATAIFLSAASTLVNRKRLQCVILVVQCQVTRQDVFSLMIEIELCARIRRDSDAKPHRVR